MRIIEIITESEQGALERDLIDLLIAAKASGIDEMPTQTLVDQLSDMGHSLTVDSLLSMYDDMNSQQRPDIIQNITADTITLDAQVSGDFVDDAETAAEDLERDTSQQAMKNIKDRAARTRRLGKDLI